MGRWKPGAKAFPVGVNFNARRGSQVNVPRPVLEALGNPTSLTFRLTRGRVVVEAGDTTRIAKRKKDATEPAASG